MVLIYDWNSKSEQFFNIAYVINNPNCKKCKILISLLYTKIKTSCYVTNNKDFKRVRQNQHVQLLLLNRSNRSKEHGNQTMHKILLSIYFKIQTDKLNCHSIYSCDNSKVFQLMSLAQLYKNYESKKRSSERTSQTIKKQIERCIQDQTISALKLQNHKVNNIHKNQQIIENKFKKQHELLSQFRNNQEVWKSLYEQLNRALMEAGDLVHYSGYVQAEIGQLLGEGTVAKYLQEAEKEDGAQQTQIQLSQTIPRKQDSQIKTQIYKEQEEDVSQTKQIKAQESYQYIA